MRVESTNDAIVYCHQSNSHVCTAKPIGRSKRGEYIVGRITIKFEHANYKNNQRGI